MKGQLQLVLMWFTNPSLFITIPEHEIAPTHRTSKGLKLPHITLFRNYYMFFSGDFHAVMKVQLQYKKSYKLV